MATRLNPRSFTDYPHRETVNDIINKVALTVRSMGLCEVPYELSSMRMSLGPCQAYSFVINNDTTTENLKNEIEAVLCGFILRQQQESRHGQYRFFELAKIVDLRKPGHFVFHMRIMLPMYTPQVTHLFYSLQHRLCELLDEKGEVIEDLYAVHVTSGNFCAGGFHKRKYRVHIDVIHTRSSVIVGNSRCPDPVVNKTPYNAA